MTGRMNSSFDNIKEALKYIDAHLDEDLTFESLAGLFHFSPYYFHRMFSVIAGRTITAHIRGRRLARACQKLAGTGRPILEIGLDSGFSSAQAFSRAFRERYGVTPSAYRKQGFSPVIETAEEMIMRFTNRLKGGILINPKIIKRGALTVLGVSGDGDKTGEVWYEFEKAMKENTPGNVLSENGYEIRVYDGEVCTVHVGYAVKDKGTYEAGVLSESTGGTLSLFKLPASTYASFDVYVANGYDSENNAMNEWLETNTEGYRERLMDNGAHYCVEYYDERFNGEEAGSVVEIWIPVEI